MRTCKNFSPWYSLHHTWCTRRKWVQGNTTRKKWDIPRFMADCLPHLLCLLSNFYWPLLDAEALGGNRHGTACCRRDHGHGQRDRYFTQGICYGRPTGDISGIYGAVRLESGLKYENGGTEGAWFHRLRMTADSDLKALSTVSKISF